MKEREKNMSIKDWKLGFPSDTNWVLLLLSCLQVARTKRHKNSGLTQESTRPKHLEKERERERERERDGYWIWILDTDTDEEGRNLKEKRGRSWTR